MAQLSTNLPYEQMLPKWASQLNPVLANLLLQGTLTDYISLTALTPLTINHMLGKTPVGWMLADNNANAVIWRTTDFNDKTLTIESSADTRIKLWIF